LLLFAICCIVSHSFCFLAVVKGSECILVMWYLSVAVLCSMGWFERKLMVVSVVVGFQYMSVSRCGVFL
jgi:hypothetical protein